MTHSVLVALLGFETRIIRACANACDMPKTNKTHPKAVAQTLVFLSRACVLLEQRLQPVLQLEYRDRGRIRPRCTLAPCACRLLQCDFSLVLLLALLHIIVV